MEKHAHKLVVQLCTIMFKSEQSVSSATRKHTKAETELLELFLSFICSSTGHSRRQVTKNISTQCSCSGACADADKGIKHDP